MAKKTVFLTGGTGNMGWESFKQLYKQPNVNIVLLARKSQKNEDKLAPYIAKPNVKVVWGDLTNYDDILECVTGSDYVLHVGGMVSPAADWLPYKTRKTNVTAAQNIVKAVLAQPNADDIKVAYTGTVAQTGDRNQPIHWGRCGDPLKISIYDHYAISKALAERVIVESGIKHWVSMRQSGILYPSILKNMDPIMFHVVINGVLEWCTVEDSGRLMGNLVKYDMSGDLPEEFWNKFYNIGSGKDYRITNYQFEEILLETLGVPGPRKLFEPNWFILKNFHGQWYADGDKLEEYLHFRENLPIKDYFARLATQVPKFFTAAKFVPNALIAPFAKMAMKKIAMTPGFGTLDWVKTKDPDRITAYYGTYQDWDNIAKTWDDFKIEIPDNDNSAATYLDHGYDENKPLSELDIEDMKQAAKFRGGECLSETMVKGDMVTKLKWRCHNGHEFEASPTLILLGGHWCPECFLPTEVWDYDEEAKHNPFFAQVWYPNHTKEEHNTYVFDEIFEGWEQVKH